jgi:hypothetical protein
MSKTVGVNTIHYVDNLGGVLLTYALQESISKLGYDCRIVDYDPTHIPRRAEHLLGVAKRRIAKLPFYLRNIRHYSSVAIRNRGLILPPRHVHKSTGLRKRSFDDFRERYIRLSEHHYPNREALMEDPPVFDAYVCGSDQVWNPYICRKPDSPLLDPAYFLRYAPESKRVSYAPSIAIPGIPESLQEEMKQFLNEIPYLSCRERQGAGLIKALTGRAAEVVLDPTLLLSQEEWSRVAVPPEMAEPYVLGYFLGNGRDCRGFALDLARKLDCRLVAITHVSDAPVHGSAVCRDDAGPTEYLGLVKNALCVCTDSYHGILFSVNFGKPFYAFERAGLGKPMSMATRVYSILDILGLLPRLVKASSVPDGSPTEIDYGPVHQRLQAERERSASYLRNALEGATSG